MSKPSKYPEWASSGAHVIEPPAGKKSDGWLSGEMPIPDYWNWVATTTNAWIEYLDSINTTPAWRWQTPLGRAAAEVDIVWSDSHGSATVSGGAGLLDGIPIHTTVGETITSLGARVSGTGAGGSVVVHLIRSDGGTTVTIATLTIPAPPATWTTYTIACSEVVPDACAYHCEVEMPTVGQSIALVGVQVAGPG